MIDQFQFYLGIQKPFLTIPSIQYQYGEKSYIKYVWDACTEVDMKLYISNLYIPQSKYTNDSYHGYPYKPLLPSMETIQVK